ncbi:MAG: PEP-CTERM sorting domain-containing protein [Thermodesulfovibrionia bacterium]|nr:PEP-CTERM sorting domain-containing protein [Thermodesulfovibrionia bacterium]
MAPSAGADTVFSNFGSGDAYNETSAWIIRGDNYTNNNFDEAFAFTPLTYDYTLDTIELAVGIAGGVNELDVWLMSDTGGQPGSIIESFNFNNQMANAYDGGSILLANSTLNPVLSAGTQYWLAADAPQSDSNIRWFTNSTSDFGPIASRLNLDPWNTSTGIRSAFRISGTVVPEPVSTILFVTGGATLGFRRFWKKRRTV